MFGPGFFYGAFYGIVPRMHTLDRKIFILSMSLSSLAGFVDAIGFMQLGGYFISFMSGNSTRLAVGIAGYEMQNVFLLVLLIGSFVGGTTIGSLLRHLFRSPSLSLGVLSSVTLLLAAGALLSMAGLKIPAMMMLAMAMGAENAIFQRDGGVVLGLTYMTGTLVKIGQKLAALMLGTDRTGWLHYVLLWAALVTGGVAGAACYHHFGLYGLWLAVGWSLGINLLVARYGKGWRV